MGGQVGNYVGGWFLSFGFAVFFLGRLLLKKMALPLLRKLHAWESDPPKGRKEPQEQPADPAATPMKRT